MNTLYMNFVYWPDGEWREAPRDCYVYVTTNVTFTWDDTQKWWVSSNGGDIIDFTPTMSGDQAWGGGAQCDCGGHKAGGGHSYWCSTKEGVL